MNILALSRFNRQGASSRLRIYQYVPYLKENGIEVTVTPLLGSAYLQELYSGKANQGAQRLSAYWNRIKTLSQRKKYDLLWIEYELFPWLPASFENLVLRSDIPYIVDYDDAVFHRYDAHTSRLVRTVLGTKISTLMQRATAVIAGNNYISSYADRAGAKEVVHIPTVVDLNRYKSIERDKKSKPFSFGWMGTPFTFQYVESILPVLECFCKEQEAQFTVIGARAGNSRDLNWMKTEIWSEDTEVEEIQNFDVGIMPLASDKWSQGKCGYKLIQYMACEKPVVASPVGVNQQIVQNGISGFLARSEEEWYNALSSIKNDRIKGNKMGKAGRLSVEQDYSLQVTAPVLLELFRNIYRGSNRCVA